MIPFADSTAVEFAVRNMSHPSVLRLVRELSINHQIIYMILYQLINHDDVVRTLDKPKTKLDHILKAGIIYCFSLGPSFLGGIVRSTPPPFDLALLESIFRAALFLGDGSILNGILSMDSRSLVNRSVLLGDSHYHPVEYSSLFGHIQATRTLLDHGGDLHWRLHRLFPNRSSPVPWTQELNTEGRAQIIQLLIGRGLLIHPEHAVSQMERCDLEELKVLIIHCLDSSFETFFIHQALPIVLLRQDWDGSFSSMISDIVERASPYQIGNQELWDEVLSESLSSAVLRNHSSAVDLLLNMGSKPTVNCLISAVRSNNQTIFKDFLKCGLDPNARTQQPYTKITHRYYRHYDQEYYRNHSCTALGESIKDRSTGAFEILQEQGFIVKLADQPAGYVSAFVAACQVGDDTLIEQLLSLQCVPGKLAGMKEALETAVEENQQHIIEKLLATGIKPTIRCLELAVQNKQLAVVKMLAICMDLTDASNVISSEPPRHDTIMFDALRWGDPTAIEHILSLDYPVHTLLFLQSDKVLEWNLDPTLFPPAFHGDWYLTLLSAAILKGNTIVVEKLMAYGTRAVLFPSRFKSYSGPIYHPGQYDLAVLTPLAAGAVTKDLPLIKELLRIGADPFDNGALFMCAILDLPEVSTMLLHAFNSRYPDGVHSFGCDAMYEVIRRKNRRLLELFVRVTNLIEPVVKHDRARRGIPPSSSPSTEWTSPLGEAIHLHSQDNGADGMFEIILPLVKDYDAIVYRDRKRGNMTCLLSAIFLDSLKTVQKLHQAGANILLPAMGRITRTPLQAAAQVGSKDIVEYLLGHGVSPNEPPSKRAGATALQLAAITGNINIATTLLEAGAEINAPPAFCDGRTAFEGATEHGRIEMMIFLVRNGANLLANNNEQYRRAVVLAEDNRQYAAKALADDLYAKVLASQGTGLVDVGENWAEPDMMNFDGFFS
jgi:ankyrin repeat protein